MTAIIFGIGLTFILVAIVAVVFKPYDYGASLDGLEKLGDASRRPGAQTDTRWRSVRVRPGPVSCDPVAGMRGKVFLSREVPELPLANCAERNCSCHYVFLDDRRSGTDRRVRLGRLGNFLSNSERNRRHSPGRRAGDLVMA